MKVSCIHWKPYPWSMYCHARISAVPRLPCLEEAQAMQGGLGKGSVRSGEFSVQISLAWCHILNTGAFR